jgi:sugar lactone lactonase YvrE
MLLLSRNRIALAPDPEGPWQEVLDHGIDFAVERINDGAVDGAGRFWFGTFSPKLEPRAGSLYCLDASLQVRRLAGDITLANGIAWSADGRTMYYVDSRPGLVYRSDFDLDNGCLGPRSVFVDYRDRPGGPDGCTVDAEGFLWVAEPRAARVSRYRPDGSLDRHIDLPVEMPTSVAFGGPDLRTLYITSMQPRAPDIGVNNPLAGAVFAARPGVQGRADPFFAG